MKVELFANADAVVRAATSLIAVEARAAIKARGRYLFAISGEKMPWQMLHDLTNEDVPWKYVLADDVSISAGRIQYLRAVVPADNTTATQEIKTLEE